MTACPDDVVGAIRLLIRFIDGDGEPDDEDDDGMGRVYESITLVERWLAAMKRQRMVDESMDKGH